MRVFFSVISGLLVIGGAIPYLMDVAKGRVSPSRSTRCMFALLLVITLLQQRELGCGWSLALTLGEVVISLMLLVLSLRNGRGGMTRLDIACYILLFVDLAAWRLAKSPLLALHLSVAADLIAFSPTLAKTWNEPKSETPLFYAMGTLAALIALFVEEAPGYSTLLFPAYLFLANALAWGLIFRKELIAAFPLSSFSSASSSSRPGSLRELRR